MSNEEKLLDLQAIDTDELREVAVAMQALAKAKGFDVSLDDPTTNPGLVNKAADQIDLLTLRADVAEAEVERLLEYERVIKTLEAKIGTKGWIDIFGGIMLHGKLSNGTKTDKETEEHTSLFDVLKELAEDRSDDGKDNS